MGIRIKQWCIDFKHQMPLQMMVLPGIIFMIVFNYIPIYGLKIAFQNYTVVDTLDSARWVGLENFRIILTDKYFWDSVVNTLGISLLKLLIGFVTPIILAIMIYELKDGPLQENRADDFLYAAFPFMDCAWRYVDHLAVYHRYV